MAIMSIETHERLCGKLELYSLLNAGLQAEHTEKIKPFEEVLNQLQKRLSSCDSKVPTVDDNT